MDVWRRLGLVASLTDEKYGIIHLDRSDAVIALATVGTGTLNHLVISTRMQSLVPATGPSGSGRRFERLIEIAIHEWFTSLGRIAEQVFRDEDLDAIIVSGSAAERFVTHYY